MPSKCCLHSSGLCMHTHFWTFINFFSLFSSPIICVQLGKMRLTVPCRAVTCSHLQCFDAALYLQMNEKKPTWICPVCDKKATYDSLIIDGWATRLWLVGHISFVVTKSSCLNKPPPRPLLRLFMEILNDCSDVDEIKFQEDGTWCPMRPKKESLKVSSPSITKVESEKSMH